MDRGRNKKRRVGASLDQAVFDVWGRELGAVNSRAFSSRLSASEDIVLRFDIDKKLDKHRGCVNTVSFSDDGDILVSGSDDRKIILWDWQTGEVKFSFHSCHHNNVFQAKIMPYTDNRTIVTCAADGQVRLAQILEKGVETLLLANHGGRAHKLAVEPGSPYIFYSCGEDARVQHFDLRTKTATDLFTCKKRNHGKRNMAMVHLNTIAIDPRDPNLLAVAGSSEYARVYDIRKYKWNGSSDMGKPVNFFCPLNLVGDEHMGITGLAFSDQSELLVSYNDEFIYLFTWEMGLGSDFESISPKSGESKASEMTGSPSSVSADENLSPQVYKGHRNSETVKGVGFFGPKCEYVVSGSDCGRIFIWNKKDGKLLRVMEADMHVVNCIEAHPHAPVLASSGIEHDIKVWTPKAIENAVLPEKIEKVLPPHHLCFGWAYSDEDDIDDDEYDEDDEEDDINDCSYIDDDETSDEDGDAEDEEDSDDDDDEKDGEAKV
ncbi:hypothetical protein MLD38_032253 [Melastoma candidum]|uniref:Uncharacterized protein n=1 Tax=Melastoma candidum TaxID=119954 RepID=A0ACB9M377_9MYRT|nr:hypothetical protein MLD38_032253 [Melastoma candidum]